jgi:hypothetical protein
MRLLTTVRIDYSFAFAEDFLQSVRACITADTIGVATGPQIRNRIPVVNSISTTPGDIGEAVIGAATVGTSKVNEANR